MHALERPSMHSSEYARGPLLHSRSMTLGSQISWLSLWKLVQLAQVLEAGVKTVRAVGSVGGSGI